MAQDTVSATVTRGPASWAFIYIALGFAISIEGTAISLITPPALSLESYPVCGYWHGHILDVHQ
jgi:hypothetical protein